MIVQHYESYSLKDEDALKLHLLDAMATGFAARNKAPKIRGIDGEVPSLEGKNSLDSAAFVNTFLIRYLDFNDTFLGLEPLHPSDMIGGLLALGYARDLTGEDLLRAMGLGYDVSVALCRTTSLRRKGFDHVNFLGIGSTVALASMLSLSHEKLRNAISLTVVPHVALRESRSGTLTHWKAGAAAEAVRNSLFATLLAESGIEGPPLPFYGKYGFVSVVANDMKLEEFRPDREVINVALKEFPVEYHAQAAVEASLKVNTEGEIKEVLVETYDAAISILADKEKWNPTNRETADHSLPFIVSYSILEKNFWLDSYSHILDQGVRDVMGKVKVKEVPEFTSMYPRKLPVRINVVSRINDSSYVDVPKGYPGNPMTWHDVEMKAIRLGLPESVINMLSHIEDVKVKEIVMELSR